LPISSSAQKQPGRRSLRLSSQSAPPESTDERSAILRRFLERARELGPVGAYQSQSDQDSLLDLAIQLKPHSDPAPARIPLSGTFDLVYSASPYVSSGRLFGPVYGRVTQEFPSPDAFCNRVRLGPLELSLTARCQAKSDTVVDVSFLKTQVSLFGNPLVESSASGGGDWKYLFVGAYDGIDGDPSSGDDGSATSAASGRRFVRVLEAPNLFVIEQVLPSYRPALPS
jgi:hypothetical protein